MSQAPSQLALSDVTPGPEGRFHGVIDAMRVNGAVTVGGQYLASEVTYDWRVWPNPVLSYIVVNNATAGTPAGARQGTAKIVPAAAGDPCDVFVQAGKIKFQVKEAIYVGC